MYFKSRKPDATVNELAENIREPFPGESSLDNFYQPTTGDSAGFFNRTEFDSVPPPPYNINADEVLFASTNLSCDEPPPVYSP